MSSQQHHSFDRTVGGPLSYVPTNNSKTDHVTLHRLWLFTAFDADLRLHEHIHILECDECVTAFRVCVGAESFGAVLKALGREKGRLAG